MTSLESLSTQLRQAGFRMTKVRIAILRFLLDQHCALSVQDILTLLKEQDLKPNISTIYRELQFLAEQEVAQEVVFKDGVIRYELKGGPHHHHLVCNSCDSIEAVEMEEHLEKVEESVQREKKFRITSHSLDFYGVCARCD